MADWHEVRPDGLVLHLRVTPRASREGIDGPERRADGRERLKIRVSAVPDEGKANAAVVALLGKALGVAPSSIELLRGHQAREKTVLIHGADASALAQLGTAAVAR